MAPVNDVTTYTSRHGMGWPLLISMALLGTRAQQVLWVADRGAKQCSHFTLIHVVIINVSEVAIQSSGHAVPLKILMKSSPWHVSLFVGGSGQPSSTK